MIGTLGQLVKDIRDKLAGTGDPIPVDIGPSISVSNESGNPIPVSVPNRTATTTSVASSISSVTILAANANRKGFSLSNISTEYLYLSFTSPATVGNCFIEIPPGSFILFDQQLMIPSTIYGIWSAVNGAAQVTEYI